MNHKKRTELLETLSNLVEMLSEDEKKYFLRKLIGDDALPVSIFCCGLSGLEAIVFYLKFRKRNMKEISKLLNRKIPTIYATYNKAKTKKVKLSISAKLLIPISTFNNRKYSVLESLVFYLKSQRYTLQEISQMLGKSYSTIKTVNWRYHQK